MTRQLWNFSLLVLGAALSLGAQTAPFQPPNTTITQATTVSGTVFDSTLTSWFGGTVTAMVINNPANSSRPVTDKNGVPVPTLYGPYTLDSLGEFSFQVQDMRYLVPPNSTMRFTFCPLSTGPCSIVNTYPNTPFNSIYYMADTIDGKINIPYFSALVVPYGYGSYQIKPLPTPGQIYYNVTTSTEGYWNGTEWVPFGGGVGTVYSVALSVPTEWTVSGSPCTSNCTLSFAWANPVSIAHGGCAGTTATTCLNNILPAQTAGYFLTTNGTNPSWISCPLCSVAALYYQTFEQNGSALTQRATANCSTRLNCTDSSSPARTNIDLAVSGVTAGTYAPPVSVTVDTYGRTTAISTWASGSEQALCAAYASAVASWCTVMADGKIMQGGLITDFDTGPSVVTFPVAFTTTCMYGTVAQFQDSGTESQNVLIVPTSTDLCTNTQMTVRNNGTTAVTWSVLGN